MLVLSSCVGEIAQPAPATVAPVPTPVVTLSPTLLRRLTRDEYRYTIADVLGVNPPEATELPDDGRLNAFVTTAGLSLSAALTTRYLDAASGIASRLGPQLPALLRCAPTDSETACLTAALDTHGTRLFRRPLTADEQAHYLGLFSTARMTGSFTDSATLVFEAMLSAPQFLFLEVPSGKALQPEALDAWQLAARLSYLLWRSAPDAELLGAARRGELGNGPGTAAQVARLMADPKAHRAVTRFFDDWLSLDSIGLRTRFETLERDALLAEAHRTIDEGFWQSGDYRTLIPKLLTSRGVMVAMSANPDSQIIYRGKFLRMRLLCGELPAPPMNVPPLPAVMEGVTSRQRIAAHTAAASCSACHSLMNPLGFALEHYDVDGNFRDTENGLALDTSVTFDEPGFRASVTGAGDFTAALAASPKAQACAVRQMFAFVFDRKPGAADERDLAALGERFAASGYDLKALLTSFTTLDTFYTRVTPPEPSP